jgi:tetratricopeptide (TPR) repeat protein
MSSNRIVQRSLFAVAIAALLGAPMAASAGADDGQEALKRFEAGRYQEALDAANPDDPASVFIAGYAAIRMDNGERAREEFRRLASNGDRTWQLIGRSASALADNNGDQAASFANEAVGASGDNPYAHYQLGMVAAKQGDNRRAAEAFARAAELKGDFAYAHYYAGLAYQREKEVGKAGDHFRRFLELAPQAPERSAVVTLLRTLGG